MSIVSYAQNFEDVMLWRALRGCTQGFYIDIGAQHPIVDSVSKLFYESGWRGVHVEPTSFYSEMLKQDRPEDDVIKAVIGDTEGVIEFYEFDGSGLSTASVDRAELLLQNGRNFNKIKVPSLRLDSLLDSYKDKTIHWLKIDVEGFEKKVLGGWRNSLVRPWILVVESTLPGTSIPSYDEWEPKVLSLGYSYVYTDGLNRFYLHHDHDELRASFEMPPNVFDDFGLSGYASHSFVNHINDRANSLADQNSKKFENLRNDLNAAKKEIETTKAELDVVLVLAEKKAAQSEDERRQLTDRLGRMTDEVNVANGRIKALLESSSWKLTLPLRYIAGVVLIWRTYFLKIVSKSIRIFVGVIDRLFNKFPRTRARTVIFLKKIGVYKFLLRSYLNWMGQRAVVLHGHIDAEDINMKNVRPAYVNVIYERLQAIRASKRDCNENCN